MTGYIITFCISYISIMDDTVHISRVKSAFFCPFCRKRSLFTGSRRGHEISTTKSDWIFWSLARLIDLTKSQQTNKNSPCVNC